MSLTYTPPGQLGQTCPDFDLPSVDGNRYQLRSFSDARVLVIIFICNHCPYVQAVEDRIIKLAQDYRNRAVRVVGICANDPNDYPEDSPDNLKERWLSKNYGFNYLYDLQQNVAKSFGAVCTPDFFVYDSQRRLAYRGRLDDSWKNPTQVKKQELRQAIEALLAGVAPSAEQNPSMGCSIKWKKNG